MGDKPSMSCNAIMLAFLVSFLIAIAAGVAGASSDVRIGILLGATAALFPMVFIILRARRRRKLMKEWQGPAYMYREVPGTPIQAVGSTLIKDNGYLQRLEPGYRYQFVDDPSDSLLENFVLLGTWAGIMEFLEKYQERMIENNCSILDAKIYMAVKPYQPLERYETWSDSSTNFVVQWLVELLSSFVPGHSLVADLPLVDLEEAVEQIRQGQKPLLEDNENQKPTHSPWSVFSVIFSVFNSDTDFHFIGERSVDFGSIRRILERANQQKVRAQK